MSVPTTDRLVALARRHQTVADMALAAGILLVSVIDAVAEQPHPAKLVIFSVAISATGSSELPERSASA